MGLFILLFFSAIQCWYLFHLSNNITGVPEHKESSIELEENDITAFALDNV